MRSLSQIGTRTLSKDLSVYAVGSLALAGLYWTVYAYIDSLPCHEILCNLEWVVAFFGPVLLVFIASPLVNYGLLYLDKRRRTASGSTIRLFFSAIGTGFSLLLIGAFVYSLSQNGLDHADLSPQSLIYTALFIGLTGLNLYCVQTIIRKKNNAAATA